MPATGNPDFLIHNIAPLENAAKGDLVYMDNPKYGEALAKTKASVCLVSKRFAAKVPSSVISLIVSDPYQAYAKIAARFYPLSLSPSSSFGNTGISPGAFIHPLAKLEEQVNVDPGAVIGPYVQVGSGSTIGAQTVIGPHVHIGRGSSIGANVTLLNALLGNRVILHPGVRVGQDGFGFAMSGQGHLKVPQIGRVIIQDDVEIGANSTIDRGASRDTIIGEGTKIDNLVQIGHNVMIGRHCIIVAQVGISGSTTLEDFVVIGGKVGIVGHVTIGEGAQIAASSNVKDDVPKGARWGGTPAKPIRDWYREVMTLQMLAAQTHTTQHKR